MRDIKITDTAVTKTANLHNVQAAEGEEDVDTTNICMGDITDHEEPACTPNTNMLTPVTAIPECDRCKMSSKRLRRVQDSLRHCRKRNAKLNQQLFQQKQITKHLESDQVGS